MTRPRRIGEAVEQADASKRQAERASAISDLRRFSLEKQGLGPSLGGEARRSPAGGREERRRGRSPPRPSASAPRRAPGAPWRGAPAPGPPREGSRTAWPCSPPDERARPRRPLSRIASTTPGRPAPAPRSAQVRAPGANHSSWALSTKWRIQKSGKVEGPTRFIRAFPASSIPRNRSTSAKPLGRRAHALEKAVGEESAVKRRDDVGHESEAR